MVRKTRETAHLWRAGVALVMLAVLLAGCAKRRPPRPPVAATPGAVELGIASWYGHPYHGRRAANGEVYDMEKLTAAHRTLPFGTWVEVLNLTNQKTVQVRINDRGPFVDGRVIDLSRAAARQIEMIGPGTAKVRLTVITPPVTPAADGGAYYAVQVGAFRDRENALRLEEQMKKRYGECRVVERDGSPPMWRVLVGREPTPERAAALAEQLRFELGAAFVVRLDESVRDRI
jgi:rare lipoprotein A